MGICLCGINYLSEFNLEPMNELKHKGVVIAELLLLKLLVPIAHEGFVRLGVILKPVAGQFGGQMLVGLS